MPAYILAFILLINCFGYAAQSQTVNKKEAIDNIFSKYHEYDGFQGSVLVAEKGNVLYKNAFGLANREWNIPNEVDSRFDIASISKQFTAMLVMQLVEEGKIHLDSTISTYYPEYRQDTGNKVSIHHLLTHRSGIPNYTSIPYVWSDSLVNHYSSDELARRFCSGDLEFEPGSRYSYNNSGYFLLSIILEKVSGVSFERLLQEKILSPAGMSNSGIDCRLRILNKRAYGYVRELENYKNAKPMYMANLQGAGNMYSTVEDLYLWDRALHSNKLLSRRGKKTMTTAYSDSSDTWITPYSNTYGYGIGLTKVPGSRGGEVSMEFHSGHITGYSSFMARFVEDEHVVIILSNTGNVSTARMNEITQEVRKVLSDQAYQVPERSMRTALFDIIQEQSVQAAIDHFYHLRESFPYDYENTEEELHALGIDLLADGKKAEAKAIFELNVKVNPSWLSYQSLGDVYHELKNFERASYYYKQSMQVNPKETEEEINAFKASERALSTLSQ